MVSSVLLGRVFYGLELFVVQIMGISRIVFATFEQNLAKPSLAQKLWARYFVKICVTRSMYRKYTSLRYSIFPCTALQQRIFSSGKECMK